MKITEKSCPISTILSAILIATKHICIDFSANSELISVEIAIYSSGALMDDLCEFGITWIKTEGAFHQHPNKHTCIHTYNIWQIIVGLEACPRYAWVLVSCL